MSKKKRPQSTGRPEADMSIRLEEILSREDLDQETREYFVELERLLSHNLTELALRGMWARRAIAKEQKRELKSIERWFNKQCDHGLEDVPEAPTEEGLP